jgi:hypothetical protein
LVFGLLWTAVGLHSAVIAFLAGLVVVTVVAAATVGRPSWSRA